MENKWITDRDPPHDGRYITTLQYPGGILREGERQFDDGQWWGGADNGKVIAWRHPEPYRPQQEARYLVECDSRPSVHTYSLDAAVVRIRDALAIGQTVRAWMKR